MTNDEYAAHMDALVIATHLIAYLPLGELRRCVEVTETLGPILEPTAYQRGGHKHLYEQRRLLDAAITLVKVWQTIQEENATQGATK